jgi:hypothetical protein
MDLICFKIEVILGLNVDKQQFHNMEQLEYKLFINQTNQEGQGKLQWHAELEAASALCRTRSVRWSGLFRQVSGDHPLEERYAPKIMFTSSK